MFERLIKHKIINYITKPKINYSGLNRRATKAIRWSGGEGSVCVRGNNKGQTNNKTKERKDVTVPGVYDAVPIVHDDHSDVVSATRSVAPAPKRRTPSRHGRVRFRRKSALLFAPPFLLLLALLITF